MTSRRARLALLALLLGCSSPSPGSTDAGVDTGPSDAGTDAFLAPDAWMPDTGVDAGPAPMPHAAAAPVSQWVDPMIGTDGLGYNDLGNTYPGPAWPFGMVHPGPDTGNELGMGAGFQHTAGYRARDAYITGFSHTRMSGTGVNDYGVIALMPTIGATLERTATGGLVAHYDHATEHAAPGRYEVVLDSPTFGGGTIGVELTASPRVGFHRITFPSSGEPAIFVDLAHAQTDVSTPAIDATLDPTAHEIAGSVHFVGGYSDRFGGVTMYFVMRFDQAFATYGGWDVAPPSPAPDAGVVVGPGMLHPNQTGRTQTSGGFYVTFPTGAVVRAAVGISYVDLAGARANLDAEDRGLDFDAARAAAVAEWERRLSVMELEGRSDTDFRLAYTALYHAMLMPTLATDVDGRYRGVDMQVATASGFTYYTDFSLWDTYRTEHSLIALVEPDTQLDFVRSMMAMAEVYGHYPRWPLGTGETDGMLGDPAAVVIADSWARGIRGFDLTHAYEMFLPAADGTAPGRGGIHSYTTLGYVSAEEGGSEASMTMEYAIADAALASMAHALGRTDDETRFTMRSHNYRNLWDPAQGFFVGRRADGTFVHLVSPNLWDDMYAEGDAQQYLWLAPQDPDGLATALGGTDAALTRLRAFFDASTRERHGILSPAYYWQGNEPDIHVPYLFAAWGAPAEAGVWSRWALRTFYSTAMNGLPGNDDAGTMSAWLLFTELGLYPIAGTDQYWIGCPLFTRATLHLPGGDLVIEAPDAWDPRPVTTGLTRDGVAIPRDRIAHDSLVHGTTLHFDVSDQLP
jgi:predicted alpha-1,2-mannosidase